MIVCIHSPCGPNRALESLLRKIKTLAPEEINTYELNDKDELEQLQYKAIKKVYGTRGKEMVDSLKKYPAVAIPSCWRG